MDSEPKPARLNGNADPAQALKDAQDALRASQEREVLLRNELSHRVRNILAVTRSIFSRTIETSDSLEHAANHFCGRLDALARYHSHSASLQSPNFDLETMILDELVAAAAGNDARIELAGPEVQLDRPVAELMGLALHELTTNSVKFGVLADTSDRSRLRISWTLADDILDLRWAESGIAIVALARMQTGFGREFIEQALPYQLGAETMFDIFPGGLTCQIRLAPRSGGAADLSD